jgi:hypothetical protein
MGESYESQQERFYPDAWREFMKVWRGDRISKHEAWFWFLAGWQARVQ